MKTVCIILGTVSLTLGIIGIFLPLLPTTPFLLLTAALYFRGSPRLYQWLLNHKCLGPYIRSFRENKAIPLRAKIISLLLMWGTMVYCIFFLIPLRNKGSIVPCRCGGDLAYTVIQDVEINECANVVNVVNVVNVLMCQ